MLTAVDKANDQFDFVRQNKAGILYAWSRIYNKTLKKYNKKALFIALSLSYLDMEATPRLINRIEKLFKKGL